MGLGKSVDKKFQPMKNPEKGCSFYNLILYSIIGLACSLFCAYPYWFTSLNNSSMKQFLFTHLPSIWSYFSNPKCLFILANLIIAFLLGESTYLGSSANSTPACDFYDEYVKRRRMLRGDASTLPDKKEEKKPCQMKLNIDEKSANRIGEVKQVIKKKEKKLKDGDDDDEEEEPGGLPAEELKKRAEEFIARVNRQRWLEARSSILCQA